MPRTNLSYFRSCAFTVLNPESAVLRTLQLLPHCYPQPTQLYYLLGSLMLLIVYVALDRLVYLLTVTALLFAVLCTGLLLSGPCNHNVRRRLQHIANYHPARSGHPAARTNRY